MNKTPVFALPFPRNEEKRESWNSLVQFDYIASARHSIATSLHGVPPENELRGSGFIHAAASRAVAPRGHECRGSVSDRYSLAGGLLESSLSLGEVVRPTGPQGAEDFVFTPIAQADNYFRRQDRRAARTEWRKSYAPAPASAGGLHRIKFGTSVMRTHAATGVFARPVAVHGLDDRVLRRIAYRNRDRFRLTDWEVGVFGQDGWHVTPSLAVDTGLRMDWQRVTGLTRMAPSGAAAWTPAGEGGPVLRTGYGWFYDRVPLSVYSFAAYPESVVEDLAFANRTEPGGPSGAFVFELRAAQLDLERVLGGPGQSRCRLFEGVARVSWKPEQELFFSHVHSRARGNLNEFAEFLGDFQHPLVRPDAVAEATANQHPAPLPRLGRRSGGVRPPCSAGRRASPTPPSTRPRIT